MEELPCNFGTFATGWVEPQALTNHQLASGMYSLSTLSTVPYVSLIGLATAEKIFSWGELVEVPHGVAVTIKNASFHAGDIVINGGRDFSTQPQRVTVPVNLTSITEDQGAGRKLIVPEWQLDTRRARRAFIAIELSPGADTTFALFTGSLVKGSKGGHSHRSANTPTPALLAPYTGARITGYFNTTPIAALTSVGIFPLGYQSALVSPDVAHALLDSSFFAASVPDAFNILNAYYILEY